MNIERLKHQIEILQDVAARGAHFDMDQWAGEWDHGCGMAACAFGYGALDPAFQAEGLRLRFTNADRRREITTIEEYNAICREAGQFEPAFDGHVGFSAAVQFFDISMEYADWLFNAANYRGLDPSAITPGHVIARIERLLETGTRSDTVGFADDC